MRTRPAYLVIDADRARIVRSTQRWPQLSEGEFAVRIRLEISEAIIPNVVHNVSAEDPDAIYDVIAEAVPVPVEAEDE